MEAKGKILGMKRLEFQNSELENLDSRRSSKVGIWLNGGGCKKEDTHQLKSHKIWNLNGDDFGALQFGHE